MSEQRIVVGGVYMGKVVTESNGDQRLYNQTNQIGRYSKQSDVTFDKNGTPVGRGNILMTLLN